MIINCKQDDFTFGTYGHVFFVNEKTMAVKVFSINHNTEQAQKVFNAEVDAYEIATKHNDASSFLPRYYGIQKINKIVIDGYDVTSEFHLDLAYAMSFEKGHFKKIRDYDVSPFSRDNVMSYLHSIGVMHVSDASVTIDNNGNILKIIDFAIREYSM